MKKQSKKCLQIILIITIIYLSIVGFIDMFKNPELTSTQRLLRIPQTLLFNFDKGKQ